MQSSDQVLKARKVAAQSPTVQSDATAQTKANQERAAKAANQYKKTFKTKSGLTYNEEDQIHVSRLIKTGFLMLLVFLFLIYFLIQLYGVVGNLIFSETSDGIPLSAIDKVIEIVRFITMLLGFGVVIQLLYKELILKRELTVDEDDLKKYD